MRNLLRNRRDLYYATPIDTERIFDEYGYDTLEIRIIYSEPILLRVNVSANIGQSSIDTFGSQTEYSRTVSIAGGSCPLTEGCPVWFGVAPTEPNNYKVVKVADSKNGFLVALQEVSANG